MQNVLGLPPIEYPHTFYLDSSPYLDRSPWEIDRILVIIKDRDGRNDASKYLHVTVLLANPVDGRENFILYYELRTSILAMRTRASEGLKMRIRVRLF